jgi:hypothetical protein
MFDHRYVLYHDHLVRVERPKDQAAHPHPHQKPSAPQKQPKPPVEYRLYCYFNRPFWLRHRWLRAVCRGFVTAAWDLVSGGILYFLAVMGLYHCLDIALELLRLCDAGWAKAVSQFLGLR